MDSPQITQILCSQNVPVDSPMEVTIKNPVENHISVTQVKLISYLSTNASRYENLVDAVTNLKNSYL